MDTLFRLPLFITLLTFNFTLIPLGAESVDVTGQSSDQQEIKLDGQWEFYWNELLYPEDFINKDVSKMKDYIEFPGSWTTQKGYPSEGYATLRLIVGGILPQTTYSLYIPEMLTSFRFFLDGKEVFSNGIVSKEKDEGKPQFLPGIVSFESEKGSIEIICQISNYDYRNSGIWRSVKLGTESVIKKNYEQKLLLEMFISIVLLTISIFHIGIYIYRKEAIAELLFGLTCLVLFFRTIATGEQLINTFIPSFPWEIARKLEYSPFYLLEPLFMTFLTSLFPKESIKWLNKTLLGIFGMLGIFFISFPIRISNHAIIIAEILLVIAIIYAFSILLRATIHKREHSLPIISAFTILALGSMNDILFSQGFISSLYLAPLGFILFIFIQSQMLSIRYARSFRKVQTLSLQLKGINESMSRFVPFQFLNYLKKNSITDVNLGDQVLENMTILFADIRSFTSLSEVMTPEENFKFLNSFLSQVVPVIREQGGFVDKFIGDAIMALFPYPPDKAVQASIELQNAVKRYNTARDRAGYRAIDLGIGIHTGPLMLGTIGETNRMETTVIADSVNIASRLEQLTKIYGSKIIISRELLDKMDNKNDITYRTLGEALVKGKSQALGIMEILDDSNNDLDKKKIQVIAEFEAAVEFIKYKNYKAARPLLEEILKNIPEDKAASFFLNQCTI